MIEINSYELEVTNKCQALCLECPRTGKDGKLAPMMRGNLKEIGIDDFKSAFRGENIKNKKFHFCGLSGDCMANKDMPLIIEYMLMHQPRSISLSTNGGLGTPDFFHDIGKISRASNIMMNFAVDGLEDTNHLYRRGVQFNRVLANMEAFSKANGKGTIKFIEFEWNSHQIEKMKELADKLSFGIRIKRSKRKERKERSQTYIPKVEDKKYIHCRYLEENDIYISAHMKVWPCCFVHFDEAVSNADFQKISDAYGGEFNDLRVHSLNEIMEHEWFQSVLKNSFDPVHEMQLDSCYHHCLKHLQDEILT